MYQSTEDDTKLDDDEDMRRTSTTYQAKKLMFIKSSDQSDDKQAEYCENFSSSYSLEKNQATNILLKQLHLQLRL